jgi:hypothetical protein
LGGRGRRIISLRIARRKLAGTLYQKQKGWGHVSSVKHLPSMSEALGSMPSCQPLKKKDRKVKKKETVLKVK